MPEDPRERIRWAEQAAELRKKLIEIGLAPPDRNDDEPFDADRTRLNGVLRYGIIPSGSPLWRRIKKVAYNAIAEGLNTLFLILLLAGARWLGC
jgi:hypothetical protein